jgi:hypothetical protein
MIGFEINKNADIEKCKSGIFNGIIGMNRDLNLKLVEFHKSNKDTREVFSFSLSIIINLYFCLLNGYFVYIFFFFDGKIIFFSKKISLIPVYLLCYCYYFFKYYYK